MKISTMRSIDKWAGIPICFIISPFCWFVDVLRAAKKSKPEINRTLFIELSEMGSAILADPAMRKLQEKESAELYFAIFKTNSKSLEILNTIHRDNIFKMNANNIWTLIKDVFRFIAWCRKRRISTVIDLELFSRFTALLGVFSGARSRIGFSNFHDEGLYRGNLVNRPVRYNPHVHISINFISLVNKTLGLFDNPYATIPVSTKETQLARAIVSDIGKENVKNKIRQLFPQWNGEEVVLFNVNASDMLPQRRWQQENFAVVAQELLEKFHSIVILATGSPAEHDYVEKVTSATGNIRCINTAGFFSFDELVPLYSLSTFMLTNDSGPAHFAAVTSLKVFVLFGPESPNLYLPLGGNAEPFYLGLPCSPCVSAANHRKTTCISRPCISGILPSTVQERLTAFLNEKKIS